MEYQYVCFFLLKKKKKKKKKKKSCLLPMSTPFFGMGETFLNSNIKLIKLFLDKSFFFSHLMFVPFFSSFFHVFSFQASEKITLKGFPFKKKKKFWMKKMLLNVYTSIELNYFFLYHPLCM